MTGLEAWVVSMFTPANYKDILGITFLVLWLWSEKLSFNPNQPANGVIQRIAPIIKALGERMAPPQITSCIEALEAKNVRPAPGDSRTSPGAVEQVSSDK